MSFPDPNMPADERDDSSPIKLATYRNAKSTAIIAASLLIPFGTVLVALNVSGTLEIVYG